MATNLAARPPPSALRPNFLESAAEFFEMDEEGNTRLRDLSDDQLQQLEAADQTLTESYNFRMEAAGTIDRLDRHLLEYRNAMIIRFKFENKLHELNSADPRSQDNDHIFFPKGNPEQVSITSLYVIHLVFV